MGKGDGENRKGDGRREKREEIARERKEGTSERGGENMNKKEKQEGRKEMFYLMMHSTHFIYGYMASDIW